MFKGPVKFGDLVYLATQWRLCHRGKPHWRTLLALIRAYAEPGRHYHTNDHLIAGLRFMDEKFKGMPMLHLAKLAWFFHDAVYEPGGHIGDNEAASAEWAFSYAIHQGFGTGDAHRIMRLILGTRDHLNNFSSDPLWGVISDADLSILGSDMEAYFHYANNIRKEYGPVYGDAALNKGRSDFLSKIKGRQIFQAVIELEEQAHFNIEAELCWLESRGVVSRAA